MLRFWGWCGAAEAETVAGHPVRQRLAGLAGLWSGGLGLMEHNRRPSGLVWLVLPDLCL